MILTIAKISKLLYLDQGNSGLKNILFQGRWTRKKRQVDSLLGILSSYKTENLSLLPLNSKIHTNYKIFATKIPRITFSVLRVFHLENFRINKREFEILIQQSYNLIALKIGSCNIDSKGCNFKYKGRYKLKHLSFEYSGHTTCSNWIRNVDKMKSILVAISKCSLKDSLNHIDLSWNSLSKVQMKEIAEELKLGGIKISGLNFLGCKRYSVFVKKPLI